MKNGEHIDWEGRLERLEADVKEIKALLQSPATVRAARNRWKAGLLERLPTIRFSTRCFRLQATKNAKKSGERPGVSLRKAKRNLEGAENRDRAA